MSREGDNKNLGFFDTENLTYYKVLDYNQDQIFKHPKYENACGISQSILKKLLNLNCKRFQWTIINLPSEETFDAICDINTFLEKKEEIYFKGKSNADPQFILRMKYFTRLYHGQGVLPKYNLLSENNL